MRSSRARGLTTPAPASENLLGFSKKPSKGPERPEAPRQILEDNAQKHIYQLGSEVLDTELLDSSRKKAVLLGKCQHIENISQTCSKTPSELGKTSMVRTCSTTASSFRHANSQQREPLGQENGYRLPSSAICVPADTGSPSNLLEAVQACSPTTFNFRRHRSFSTPSNADRNAASCVPWQHTQAHTGTSTKTAECRAHQKTTPESYAG